MPIHYSTSRKTKHVSPVSPCPSPGYRGTSSGGRIHTLSFLYSRGPSRSSRPGRLRTSRERLPQRSEESSPPCGDSRGAFRIDLHTHTPILICRHFFLTLRFNENSQKFWKIRHPKVFSKIFNNESYANSAHF